MPAFIAHIFIADTVCEKIGELSKNTSDKLLTDFVKRVLDEHRAYVRLGAIGPDLPYYGSFKSLIDALWHRPNKPTGVDQWSYQLHSKDPNLFPLKMAEIIWKESNPIKGPQDPWEEEDEQKFAFVCGYLTHMAADQIIHPFVNSLAGPYTKTGDARELHAECEVHQDLYLMQQNFGKHTLKQYIDELLKDWTDISWENNVPEDRRQEKFPKVPISFRYLIQKSFVEAHAVRPWHRRIQSWVNGFWFIQHRCYKLKLYKLAHNNMFKQNGELNKDTEIYKRYIRRDGHTKCYDEYVKDAEELSSRYIFALLKLHENEIDDAAREKFLKVVQNADLAAPLKEVI